MDAQSLADPQQVQGGAVPYPSLNARHVAAADLGEIGECFLGEILVLTQAADAQAEPLQGWMSSGLARRARHSQHAGALHLFGPRPIGRYLTMAQAGSRNSF